MLTQSTLLNEYRTHSSCRIDYMLWELTVQMYQRYVDILIRYLDEVRSKWWLCYFRHSF